MAKKILIGFLLLVILTSSIYVMLQDKVKINVEKTRTKYYVWENEEWVLGGTEYVHLYDGTKKMRAKSREVKSIDYFTSEFKIVRTSKWKDNITTVQTYYFDGRTDDVELTPKKNIFECYNCKGKIVHYEFRDLTYDGPTRQATSPERFGHNMVVEWEEGNYYAKIHQQKITDKLIVKYKPTKDYEMYYVRMFDPEINTFNDSTVTLGNISFSDTGNSTIKYINVTPNSTVQSMSITLKPFKGRNWTETRNFSVSPGVTPFGVEYAGGYVWYTEDGISTGKKRVHEFYFNGTRVTNYSTPYRYSDLTTNVSDSEPVNFWTTGGFITWIATLNRSFVEESNVSTWDTDTSNYGLAIYDRNFYLTRWSNIIYKLNFSGSLISTHTISDLPGGNPLLSGLDTDDGEIFYSSLLGSNYSVVKINLTQNKSVENITKIGGISNVYGAAYVNSSKLLITDFNLNKTTLIELLNPKELKIDLGNDGNIDYSNDSINSTITVEFTNLTVIQNCIDSCTASICQCSINFSGRYGILEWSELNVSYHEKDIILESPSNNSLLSEFQSSDIDFTYSIINSTTVINCSLYADFNGTHLLNQTKVGYNSTFCAQETSNVSTSCGGLNTGAYGFSGSWTDLNKTYDGDYSTFGFCNSGSCTMYINYSVPGEAVNTSLWEIKAGGYQLNHTINASCWRNDTLQLRIIGNDLAGTTFVSNTCFDGSDWVVMFNATAFGNRAVYEEKMHWNLSFFNKFDSIGLDVGTYNWEVKCCDPDDCFAPKGNFTFRVYTFFNYTQGGNLTYAPNWTSSVYSNTTSGDWFNSGNFTITITEYNITTYPVLNWTFNVTNNNGTQNLTVFLKQLEPQFYTNWRCNNVNVTTSFTPIINVSNRTFELINCTLDLLNATQLYTNWSLISDNASWNISYEFSSTII